MPLNPIVAKVTDRIIARSAATRAAYLDLIARARDAGVNRDVLSCGNLAHGFAAAGDDKIALRTGKSTNIGVITAYNDMLSSISPMAATRSRSRCSPAKSAPPHKSPAACPQCATG